MRHTYLYDQQPPVLSPTNSHGKLKQRISMICGKAFKNAFLGERQKYEICRLHSIYDAQFSIYGDVFLQAATDYVFITIVLSYTS